MLKLIMDFEINNQDNKWNVKWITMRKQITKIKSFNTEEEAIKFKQDKQKNIRDRFLKNRWRRYYKNFLIKK